VIGATVFISGSLTIEFMIWIIPNLLEVKLTT
jgi:hypothetical protein